MFRGPSQLLFLIHGDYGARIRKKNIQENMSGFSSCIRGVDHFSESLNYRILSQRGGISSVICL